MKNILILSASLIAIWLLFSAFVARKFFPPVKLVRIRGCDAMGCGYFGASRDGGSRRHLGIDIMTNPGEWVYAPISGAVSIFQYNGMWAVRITKGKEIVKILYLSSVNADSGDYIYAGTKIGRAANMVPYYGAGMTNHIHLEYIVSGAHKNPASKLVIINTPF